MPDDFDPTSPFGGVDLTSLDPMSSVGSPDLAQKFHAKHQTEMDARQKQIDNIFSQQKMTAEMMTKILDDTTSALKASRKGQVNLPLMAMAAGMLSNRGNFGNQLGAGLGAAVPTIQKDREEEDAFQEKLAKLGMMRGQAENMPMQNRLDYLKSMQSGDLAAQRGIETGLIRTQGANELRRLQMDQRDQQQISQAVEKAISEARRQADSFAKDNVASNEEREAEYRRLLLQNLDAYRASGLKIPDEVVQRITKGGAGAPAVPGAKPLTRKNFLSINSTDPEFIKRGEELGLPDKPVGYVYDTLSPDKRVPHFEQETKNYDKESSDWINAGSQAKTMLDQIDRSTAILKKYPNITGYEAGVVPGNWVPSTSAERQYLEKNMVGLNISNIPKNQGAVSNMERELFEKAGANLRNDPKANLNILAAQRAALVRDQEKRDFLESYFNHYGTIRGAVQNWEKYIASPEGQVVVPDDKDVLRVNDKRMPWQEYFRSKRAAGRPQLQEKARGGAIRLGAEYD